MRRFRYRACNGSWFKGNTHVHSTCSDGGKNFVELADIYAGAGYDFLFRTDHRKASDVESDTDKFPLLWLNGIELDGFDEQESFYHVVCLGTFSAAIESMEFAEAMKAAKKQDALMILAHPAWSGNSQGEIMRYGFDGVEIYNHVCRWLNGKSDGMSYWNMMLPQAPATLGFAVDDSHTKEVHPGWNGGWIVINAPELTRDNVMTSIRQGHFYSSTGPDFQAIEFDGTNVTIKTSPVQFVRLVGERWDGERRGSFGGERLTEAAFEINPEWTYMYIEIEDDRGRRAWTNPLFVPE